MPPPCRCRWSLLLPLHLPQTRPRKRRAAGDPVPARAPIVVHVVGCVRKPGVYLAEGARVAMPQRWRPPQADLEAVNLAARLMTASSSMPRKSRPRWPKPPGPRAGAGDDLRPHRRQ